MQGVAGMEQGQAYGCIIRLEDRQFPTDSGWMVLQLSREPAHLCKGVDLPMSRYLSILITAVPQNQKKRSIP